MPSPATTFSRPARPRPCAGWATTPRRWNARSSAQRRRRRPSASGRAPMADEAFYQDAYLRRCRTRVISHDASGLVTEATVFYPLGGGQPGDSGLVRLADGAVIRIGDTRRDRDSRAIQHQLESGAPQLAPGSEIELELDWERRYRHMRMHTCLHLLSAGIKAGC